MNDICKYLFNEIYNLENNNIFFITHKFYICHNNCLITMEKTQYTLDNEIRKKNNFEKLHALYRASELRVINILDIMEKRYINEINDDNNNIIYKAFYVVKAEPYDFNIENIYGSGIRYRYTMYGALLEDERLFKEFKFNGYVSKYDDRGLKLYIFACINGIRNGLYIEYKNYYKKCIGKYKDGNKDGVWVEYGIYGDIIIKKSFYDNGKPIGLWTIYRSNKSIKETIMFKDNNTGLCNIYYMDDRKIHWTGTIKKEKRVGKWTEYNWYGDKCNVKCYD